MHKFGKQLVTNSQARTSPTSLLSSSHASIGQETKRTFLRVRQCDSHEQRFYVGSVGQRVKAVRSLFSSLLFSLSLSFPPSLVIYTSLWRSDMKRVITFVIVPAERLPPDCSSPFSFPSHPANSVPSFQKNNLATHTACTKASLYFRFCSWSKMKNRHIDVQLFNQRIKHRKREGGRASERENLRKATGKMRFEGRIRGMTVGGSFLF